MNNDGHKDIKALRSFSSLENRSALEGIHAPYTAEDVVRLRGTVHVEHTLAELRGRAAVGAGPHRSSCAPRSAR